MRMRVHELHPSLVHIPLVLLPTAAALDLTAALSENTAQARLGRKFWWLAAGGGLLTGLSGMAAASQQVENVERRIEDTMWLHGIGNVALVVGAFGMAAWRAKKPPSVLQASIGLAACAASLYTAWLGGELVYGHGVGIKALPDRVPTGPENPPLFSVRGPWALLREGVRGFAWLVTRATQVISGRAPIDRKAIVAGEIQMQPASPTNTLFGR